LAILATARLLVALNMRFK